MRRGIASFFSMMILPCDSAMQDDYDGGGGGGSSSPGPAAISLHVLSPHRHAAARPQPLPAAYILRGSASAHPSPPSHAPEPSHAALPSRDDYVARRGAILAELQREKEKAEEQHRRIMERLRARGRGGGRGELGAW